MFHTFVCLLFVTLGSLAQDATTPQDASDQATQMVQASKMLSFAKQSLIENTQLAKDEFGIKDDPKPEKETPHVAEVDKKYNSTDYRDIFYSATDSTLVNQAYDYFKQGKRMQKVDQSQVDKKLRIVRKPIIKLHSIMYNNTSSWTVFTSAGKFSYTKPNSDILSITGISDAEVEFVIPIQENMKDAIRTMNDNVLDYKNRVSIQNRNLVVRLHIGECIFPDELKIVTKCTSAVDDFEKQVDI